MQIRRFCSLLVAALPGILAGAAHANVISTLYSTGVDNGGSLLADGAVDTHYTATPGGGPFTFANTATIGWVGNTANSQWISPAADTHAGPGPFTYTTTFDLTGLVASTAAISGMWSTDNQGVMFLNGVQVAVEPFGAWQSLAAFSITAGFQAGLNSLTFEIPNNLQNPQAGDGPTGLQVQILSASADAITVAVPLPATSWLFAIGLLWIGVAARRRVWN